MVGGGRGGERRGEGGEGKMGKVFFKHGYLFLCRMLS